MTPRTDIAERILALPLHEQKLAIVYFRRLVEQQRAAMGPTPISCVEMARSIGLGTRPVAGRRARKPSIPHPAQLLPAIRQIHHLLPAGLPPGLLRAGLPHPPALPVATPIPRAVQER